MRLAQGALAAVDARPCGMLQAHIGALMLRLAPSALAELAHTLNHAVAAHAPRFSEPSDARSSFGLISHERGEA